EVTAAQARIGRELSGNSAAQCIAKSARGLDSPIVGETEPTLFVSSWRFGVDLIRLHGDDAHRARRRIGSDEDQLHSGDQASSLANLFEMPPEEYRRFIAGVPREHFFNAVRSGPVPGWRTGVPYLARRGTYQFVEIPL